MNVELPSTESESEPRRVLIGLALGAGAAYLILPLLAGQSLSPLILLRALGAAVGAVLGGYAVHRYRKSI